MSGRAGKRVVWAMLALGAATLAPAAEAKPVGGAIEIVSPHRGKVHVAPGTRQPLKVRVRVKPGVSRLRAVVGARGKERVVTKRFQRGRKGVLVATLRPGRELRPGPGAVRVSGRRAGKLVAASAHFWVASRRTELLAVRGLPRRSAARPLTVRMRTPRRVEDLRVRVNGVDARHAFTRTVDGRWSGALSASAGLRYGRNRVDVTAYTLHGGYERVSRVVRVQRGRPLVGAGPDVVVRQRARVRLDGRDTRPRKGERLRYTWRIVRRPKGSKARIRHPHAVRPRLRADRPGRYQLRLTVHPLRVRGKASAAAVAGADTVTVSAQPAVAPVGQRVQTIAVDGESGPGIKVGRAWYPMPPPDLGGQGAVQIVVLDGTTGEGLLNESFPGNDEGMQFLLDELEDVGDSSIVLLAQPPSVPLTLGQAGTTALQQVWGILGFEPGSSWRMAGGEPGYQQWPLGWSIVGVPASGAVSGLVGIQQSASSPAGAMDGFLRNTTQTAAGEAGSSYVFNYGAEYIPYDTFSGGDGVTQNQMAVNGATYTSGSFSSGSAFHLVWLDGGTLQKLGEATIEGNDPQGLVNTLQNVANAGPALLFMTTIGTPSIPVSVDGTDPGWAAAAKLIAAFGGNANAFLSLDGSANAQYSLAGASGIGAEAPNAGVDVSRKMEPGAPKPRLIGLLERRPAGAYAPSTGDAPTGTVDAAALLPVLKQVLAQKDQPFEPFDGPGEPEAEAYIAEQLNLTNDPVYGIRANYWDPRRDAQWTNLQASINDPHVVPPCTDSKCSPGFKAVQAQLDREFEMVARVRTYFGSYSAGTLYGDVNEAFTSSAFGFDQVAEYITSKYPPQESQASGASPLEIIEGVLDMTSELVPEGGEAYAIGMSVAAAAIEIGNGFADGDDSGGYAGATYFEADASQFASVLQQRYTASLGGLNRVADLLVSDAGRLQAASTGVLGNWAADPGTLSGALNRSMAGYMWASLLPAAFDAYQCIVPPVYYPPEDFRPSPWYPHDVETPTGVQWPIRTVTNWPARTPGGWGPSGDPTPQVNDFGFLTVGGEIAGDFTYLDGGVARNLFAPISQSNTSQLGLQPAYLFAPQPQDGGAGFELDAGAYDASTYSVWGYVRYLCANDEWREDTNERGQ